MDQQQLKTYLIETAACTYFSIYSLPGTTVYTQFYILIDIRSLQTFNESSAVIQSTPRTHDAKQCPCREYTHK